MDVRKSAVDLSGEERDRFLEAVIRLKHRPVANGPPGLSCYDQFVAVHGAIMNIIPPGHPPDADPVNYGHFNIGFCAWHRQFVRDFEKALQGEVAGVTVPYWDWADHGEVVSKLFTGEFLGSLHHGAPAWVTDSVLRNPVPAADRPAWWPAGADGYPIHQQLTGGITGSVLARGSQDVAWDVWQPTEGLYAWLEQLVVEQPDVHPFWYFWVFLESGPSLTAGGPRLPTHNAGHNFIGGHMSAPAVSPNDPVFWLHHANVDRLWANWQARRLAAVAGSTPLDHYPPPDNEAPFGNPQPQGHRLHDLMWPWVGTTPGYSVRAPAQLTQLLPDYSGVPAVSVRDVLDTETMDAVGYRYAVPEELPDRDA